MITFKSLEFLGLSHRIPGNIKNAFYRLEISALVPEIFKFEKCVKYANDKIVDVTHSTQYNIKYINRAISVNLQQKTLKLARLKCSTGISPTALKNWVPMASHSFPVSAI